MRRILLSFVLAFALTGNTDAGEKPGAVAQTLVKTTASWNGSSIPAYPVGQPEVTILRIRIEPGATLPVHKHPVINAGVLLSGELTVITERDEVLHMKAGDPINDGRRTVALRAQ